MKEEGGCKGELEGGVGIHTTLQPEAQSFISVSSLVKQPMML